MIERLLVAVSLLAGSVILPGQANADQAEQSADDQLSAQPMGVGYSISRSRISGGGRLAEGGAYTLHGTVGQHEAQQVPAPAGASFTMRTGFWIVLRQNEPALVDVIFRDRFRND